MALRETLSLGGLGIAASLVYAGRLCRRSAVLMIRLLCETTGVVRKRDE